MGNESVVPPVDPHPLCFSLPLSLVPLEAEPNALQWTDLGRGSAPTGPCSLTLLMPSGFYTQLTVPPPKQLPVAQLMALRLG